MRPLSTHPLLSVYALLTKKRLSTLNISIFFCREQALFFCTIAVPKLHIRCTSLSNSTVIAMLYFLLRILFFSSGKTVGEKSVFNNFNALTGLSCYICAPDFSFYDSMPFQCPHGLELLRDKEAYRRCKVTFQCPYGLELLLHKGTKIAVIGRFQCPLGLELLPDIYYMPEEYAMFQCPLGLIHHFYSNCSGIIWAILLLVSMPSRAYTSFLLIMAATTSTGTSSVSMPSRAYTSFLRNYSIYDLGQIILGVNALSGLYLISTVPLQKSRFYAVSRGCFCRHLSEYSDNSRFSCMLTFWTYLMRCTYPWHWLKYSTNYNRCHPIFSLSW